MSRVKVFELFGDESIAFEIALEFGATRSNVAVPVDAEVECLDLLEDTVTKRHAIVGFRELLKNLWKAHIAVSSECGICAYSTLR